METWLPQVGSAAFAVAVAHSLRRRWSPAPSRAPAPAFDAAFGVRRGKCRACNGACAQYQTRGAGGPCLACGHFPVAHADVGSAARHCTGGGCQCERYEPWSPAGADEGPCLACGHAHAEHSGRAVAWELDAAECERAIADGQLVGRGSFGVVYRGVLRGKELALKRLSHAHALDEEDRQTFYNECVILSRMRHPNVLQFVGASLQWPHPTIVSEFLPRGSLAAVLRDGRVVLSWRQKLAMITDVACGMAYLASRSPPVLHRDLKTENLLLGADNSVKLCDFGLAMVRAGLQDGATSGGTPVYMAPEVMRREPYSEAADCYSFALVAWEVCTAREPFSELADLGEVRERVQAGHRPPIPAWCPPRLAALLRRCWAPRPQDRPSWAAVLAELALVGDVSRVLACGFLRPAPERTWTPAPVPALEGQGVLAVSAGLHHAAATALGGGVFLLGQGGRPPSGADVVPGAFASVCASGDHTLAVTPARVALVNEAEGPSAPAVRELLAARPELVIVEDDFDVAVLFGGPGAVAAAEARALDLFVHNGGGLVVLDAVEVVGTGQARASRRSVPDWGALERLLPLLHADGGGGGSGADALAVVGPEGHALTAGLRADEQPAFHAFLRGRAAPGCAAVVRGEQSGDLVAVREGRHGGGRVAQFGTGGCADIGHVFQDAPQRLLRDVLCRAVGWAAGAVPGGGGGCVRVWGPVQAQAPPDAPASPPAARFRVPHRKATESTGALEDALAEAAAQAALAFKSLPCPLARRCELAQVVQGGGFSAALTVSGRVLAWGALGGAALGSEGAPLPGAPADVAQLAAAESSLLMRTRAGALFVAGGDGDAAVARCEGPALEAIAAGAAHAVGLEAGSGRLWELRDGGGLRPLEAPPCVAVACGQRHAAAVTADGRLLAWGDGASGALGMGRAVAGQVAAPTEVPGLRGVRQVACGDAFTVVLCSADG